MRDLFGPHPYKGMPGVIGGNCLTCGCSVVERWHNPAAQSAVQLTPKEAMTPQEISAVATTLELIRKSPPKDEHWDHPGTRSLAEQVQAWLKEQL